MKSLTKTTLKIALTIVLGLAGMSATAKAQDSRIQTGPLDALAPKASETVDVTMDERLIQMAAKFLSGQDDDEAKIKALINGLKGIYVKSFEFDSEGQYSEADLEGIRTQLRNPAWSRILSIQSKKEGRVEVYLMQTADRISGLTLLATDPKEITFVNIVGPVDLNKLSELEGNFGIPVLDLDRERLKSKTKN